MGFSCTVEIPWTLCLYRVFQLQTPAVNCAQRSLMVANNPARKHRLMIHARILKYLLAILI